MGSLVLINLYQLTEAEFLGDKLKCCLKAGWIPVARVLFMIEKTLGSTGQPVWDRRRWLMSFVRQDSSKEIKQPFKISQNGVCCSQTQGERNQHYFSREASAPDDSRADHLEASGWERRERCIFSACISRYSSIRSGRMCPFSFPLAFKLVAWRVMLAYFSTIFLLSDASCAQEIERSLLSHLSHLWVKQRREHLGFWWSGPDSACSFALLLISRSYFKWTSLEVQ